MVSRVALSVLILFVVLGSGPAASAWHEPDETEYGKHGSLAGDPRVLDDAGGCLDDTKGTDGFSCAVLYAHILSLRDSVPLNTQRPGECAEDLARGYAPVVNGAPHRNYSRMSLYPADGFVEYMTQPEDAGCEESPWIPIRHWLMDDLDLSRNLPIRSHWFLGADTLEVSPLDIGTGPDSTTPTTGAMPCLTVRMILQTGRYVGSGEVIAEGQTTKTVVSTPYGHGDMTTSVQDPCPGATGVVHAEEATEFVVDLGPAKRNISRYEGFVVDVQWFQHEGASGDPGQGDALTQANWNMRTGSDFPNRLVLPLAEAITVKKFELVPSYWDEDVWYIQIGADSSWSKYDVDARNVRLSLFDQSGSQIPLKQLGEPKNRPQDMDGYVPYRASIRWDWRNESLEPGDYTLRVSVPNWQHTAHGEAELWFSIASAEQPMMAAPGAAPLLALVVLALAGLAARHKGFDGEG